MVNKDPLKIDELLSRGVAEVIDREHLRSRLLSGEKLRVKLGIDPTSPNLHIGRSVPLLKLRDFQELGHQIVFIVGDFTGEIGDTSDKESERPMLGKDAITENLKTYVEQAGKIIDLSRAEICHNSEWLAKLGFGEIGRLADAFSLAEFSARENIKKRLDAGKRVSLREMMYPLMQGYDSVAVRADVELGGTDQRFNLLAGRHLQPLYGQEPQDILMNDLVMGTDGRKMSSSWGNTINLYDAPNDMFGKVMSVRDEQVIEYFIHCTRVSLPEIEEWESRLKDGGNPRDAKAYLGKALVSLYHSPEAAEEAEAYFVNTFAKGEVPAEVPVCQANKGQALVEFLVAAGLAESKSDARRKIEQGGVSMNEAKILDPATLLGAVHDGQVLKIGKKDFVRVQLG